MTKPYSTPFDLESDIHGVRVIVTREPVSNACLTDDEVDHQIDALVSLLESLRSKMKVEAKRLRTAPPDLQVKK